LRIANRVGSVLLAAGLVGLAVPAHAVEVVIGGHAGYGSYTQEDLNALIRYIDAGAGALDEVKSGAEFGGLIGVKLNNSALLALAYTRLTLSTSGASGAWSAEVSAPADCWLLSFSWLPDNDKVGRIGLGADAGIVTAKGFIAGGAAPGRTRVDFEGSGLFLAGYVVADVQLGGRTGAYLHGGFRLANLGDVDLNGEPPGESLDYSGAFARAGLRVSLGGEPR
jgi:hypothetical protein